MVSTVKKDKSVKIAQDSKKLNDAIHKNKYQMQSIDHLIDSVAVYISERRNLPGKYFFPKIDLKYAYSQIPLDENIQKHKELVHELSLTFTRPRNLTFDRFQFFRALQQSNESLETFYSRLRELGSHAKLEHLEEDLVKDLFISNMQSSNIQMELLSGV